MKMVITLLIFAGSFFFTLQPVYADSAGDPPQAHAGVLDLSKWDFNRDGNVKLRGEWEFYWHQLLTPADFSGRTEAMDKQFVLVPGIWGRYEYRGEPISNHGFATYRLRIRLDESDADNVKALYIKNVATSYRLWANGALIASNGVVGTSEAEMVPKNYAKVVSFVPNASEVELVIQVANFVQRKGGLWEPILFGSEKMIHAEREKTVASTVFLVGCLAVTGIYHLVLFLLQRKDKSVFLFAVLCLGFIFRVLVVEDVLLAAMFPQLSWETILIMEYLPIYLGVPLLVRYIQMQYPDEMNRKFPPVSLAVGILFSLLVFLTPAKFYTHAMVLYEAISLATFLYILAVTMRAALRRKAGGLANMVAIAFLFIATLSATLYYNHILPLGDSLSIGVFAYLFAQSHLLSVKFVRSNAQVEKLSKELQELNASLEAKVRERTIALEEMNCSLQQANQEISRMEESRKRLMSNISHELGTPLDVIQGYLKAMLDGVIAPHDRKYITLMYDKRVYLDRIIEDLFELSRLESSQLAFHYQTVPVLPFIRQLYEKHELEMKRSGFRFMLELPEEPVRDGQGVCVQPVANIDPVRIEQVMTNLLVNAQKFTPVNGSITIRAVFATEGFVQIEVSDTGRGIAADELPYVFERFYKGSSSRQSKAAGVGLGLSIAKEIIRRHGGEIGAESTLGAGSTFYFTLPVQFVEDRSAGEVRENERGIGSGR